MLEGQQQLLTRRLADTSMASSSKQAHTDTKGGTKGGEGGSLRHGEQIWAQAW